MMEDSLMSSFGGLAPLKVYLNFGKLEGKKRILESNFLSTVWFEGSQKEKIERKNARKI